MNPPEPVTLSKNAALAIMDEVTRRHFACTAHEFLDRWDVGEYISEDTPELAELVTLIPFVR